MFIFSFLLGGLGAFIAMKFAGKLGLIDIPNHRSSHVHITPKGGGIGVLAAFLLGSLMLQIPVSLWLPSLVIALIGLWGGDKRCLSVKQRLFIQFGCSLVFLVFFLSSKQVAPAGYLLCVPLSVFMVGTSNFYNFMDGIDGIAGVTGVVGFSLLCLHNSIFGTNDTYTSLSLVLAFSCLGFLCFNFPKAKVFLGDLGSILLGFVFACLTIVLSETLVDFITMVGFLAPFYFDELLTMVVRIKNRDDLTLAHRKHMYQLLTNELGIRHWKVASGYGLAQLVIGGSVIFLKPGGVYFILPAYLVYSLVFVWASWLIRKKVFIQCK